MVICDDEEGRRDDWKAKLEALLNEVQPVEIIQLSDQFTEHYEELLERRLRARKQRGVKTDEPVPLSALPDADPTGSTHFDIADVLVVDYDLFRFREHEYLTGAVVAYLARCYSSCRAIVGVNEYGSNPFDLTLADTPESFTDLIIGEEQIDNPRLWFGQSSGQHLFRPWSWPPVIDLAERHARLAERCRAQLGKHVLDVTGLGAVHTRLPRSATGWLQRAGQREERTSLEDLARGARLGLRRGDEATSRQAVARIAAARTAKWLSQVVLPLQDVLIDAPHLVTRNAALMMGTDLDATACLPCRHADCPLVRELEADAHSEPEWLSVPTYYWPQVAAHHDLPGVANPYDIPATHQVFCEDLSSFLPNDKARRFVSRLVDSSSPARWIADPEASGIEGLGDIDYEPQSRLAL